MKTTFMANSGNVERKWFVVDAEGQTLGRLAAEVAKVLRGKHKPTFTPHVDTGDFVIVVNADKVKLTGKKFRKPISIIPDIPADLRLLRPVICSKSALNA